MLSTFGATGRRGPGLLVLILIAAFVAACGASAGAPGAAPLGPGSDGEQPGQGANGEGQAPGSGTGGDGAGRDVVYSADTPNLLIIKTGDMVLQVTGIDAALASATQQITALGGYASGSERFGEKESEQASITFRIPAARWDEALAGLRTLGTKVLT
jgi:hypothetical protein